MESGTRQGEPPPAAMPGAGPAWLAHLGRSAGRICGPGDPFVCEGRFAVEALVVAGSASVLGVVIEAGRHEDLAAWIQAEYPDIPVARPGRREIAALAGFDFHRGVLAFGSAPPACRVRDWCRTTEPGRRARRLAVACGLADGSNVGALVRNAAAFGCDALVVEAGRGASPWSRKAVRSSAGTVFRIPVLASPDLAGDLAFVADDGWRIVAAVADPAAPPLEAFDVAPDDRIAVLFGNEGHGLDPAWLDRCPERVRIGLRPGVESLNVAAASAVILHHLRPPSAGAPVS